MTSEIFEVSLQGGSPWGFRLQGGKEFRAPLLIAKVTSGSKAAKQGILVGDWLININDEPCDTMTHTNALNCIKKTGNTLVLTLERRPSDENVPYSTYSLPRPAKKQNNDSNNNDNNAYKSIEGYATLPRKKKEHERGSNVDYDYDITDRAGSASAGTRSSSGISSKYSDEGDEIPVVSRANMVMSPSSDDWSPDLISDAVRPPQPIRLISKDDEEPDNNSASRVKSPTSLHGFTDKPEPVGRGARRINQEEMKDSKDNQSLHSGAGQDELFVDDETAAEQPYRRYSYHGSVMREQKTNDGTERPRINAGSGWYKELFKEMHSSAGTSSGLSSLLAGDNSGTKQSTNTRKISAPSSSSSSSSSSLRTGRRSRTKSQEHNIKPSEAHKTFSEPTTEATIRNKKPERNINPLHRHSTGTMLASTEPPYLSDIGTDATAYGGVKMREKPTTRNNVPSWYKQVQQGKAVSEEEILEDRRMPRPTSAPSGVRSPGNVGPEYPVVRGYAIGTRPAQAPVIHRDPPQQLHTQTYRQPQQQYQHPTAPFSQKPTSMIYSQGTNRTTSPPLQDTKKPSAANLYENHMRNRQSSPKNERKFDMPTPTDYVKKFEEEEERYKEDERRAKEDLERKIREGEKAIEEAERKRLEIERKKQEEIERRKNPKNARALYEFTPQTTKEIGFKKGDIVTFFRNIDANWCEGEINGRIGLFPTSFVEIIPDEVILNEGEGRVKYNFKAESARELNLQKGDIVILTRQVDKNWFEGKKDGRMGIFPVSYIEIYKPITEQSPQTSPMIVQETVIKQNGLPEVQSSPNHHLSNSKASSYSNGNTGDIKDLDGEKYLVVFGYAPQNEDELHLSEGDYVKVVEKCDDGWFVGISETTGEFGTFPGNYVKLTS